jgi:hypothetical protein
MVMKWRLLVCFVLALSAATPCAVLAQGLDDTKQNGLLAMEAGGFLSPAQGFQPSGIIGPAGIGFRPFLQAGIQLLGFNFNLPAFAPLTADPAPLDLRIRNANLWTGAAGLEAYLPRGFSVFLQAQGNLPRNVTVLTGEQPFEVSFPEGRQAVQWTGSRLEWWQIEGALSYRASSNLSFLAGLKRDHLSVRLNDPVDAAGNSVNYGYAVPDEDLPGADIVYNQAASADLLTKIWIPYLGMQLDGANYRASLLFSPFATVSTRIPLRIFNFAGLFVGPFPLFTSQAVGEWDYRMSRPGCYLEGALEYNVNLNSAVSFQLWGRGTWLDIKGTGTLNDQDRGLFSFLGIRQVSAAQADSALGHVSRTLLGAGLSATVSW